MSCTFTPSRCHINLAALVRNFQKLGPARNLMPVIKSDAYGHGLIAVAKALSRAGAARFAVGSASEGKELRKHGFQEDIVLLMGCLDKDDWQCAVKNRLIPIAGSFSDLEAASSALNELGADELTVAIKCDTGMARLGFIPDEIPMLLQTLKANSRIRPGMLVSHLACADMPEETEFTAMQIRQFETFHKALLPAYQHILRSLGNSAAVIGLPETRYDIARPGLALYGGNPFAGTSLGHLGDELEWVMSVSSPILHIRELAAGQSISYGRIFTAQRPMRVAIAACGYATGINRNLSGKFSMLVNGKRAPQIGRICMSMLMLDISHIKNVKAGDVAWILGGPASGGEKPVDACELADILDTIPYEIVCSLGAMNPRVYEFGG